MAHTLWQGFLQPGDVVVDATCGNGKDLLFLCQTVLTDRSGSVFALDVQTDAIEQSRSYLQAHLSPSRFSRVTFFRQCHSSFPQEVRRGDVQLIVYNLGYRPNGNKCITTRPETTKKSLLAAMELLSPEGKISITCYPGHPEGALEQEEIVTFLQTLPLGWNFHWIIPPQPPLTRPALLFLHR